MQHCTRLHRCLRCVKVLLSLSWQRREHSESSDRFSAVSELWNSTWNFQCRRRAEFLKSLILGISLSPVIRGFDCRTQKWQQDLKQLGPWMSLNVLDSLQLHHQTWCKYLVGKEPSGDSQIQRSMVWYDLAFILPLWSWHLDLEKRLNESNQAQVYIRLYKSFQVLWPLSSLCWGRSHAAAVTSRWTKRVCEGAAGCIYTGSAL